jgi:DNA replication and repair protein RecF
MSVVQLTIQNFRNLINAQIIFHEKLNFIIGHNGSGKSSILEAIFFIGHGKSFRTSKNETIVTYHQNNFVVSITDDLQQRLGISRNISTAQFDIKLNGNKIYKLSDLAANIAVQIVTPESFKLFFGGPKERRRFIDLGLFHVKHEFPLQWKIFAKLLKQRNACLRAKIPQSELSYWTENFCKASENISEYRQQYISALQIELLKWLAIVLPELQADIELQYFRGWSAKRDLAELLAASLEKEYMYGYTISGAHKFDLRILVNKQPLELVLSRGQQKLFLLALTLAQTKLIEQVKQVKPILLIDDIGAELDQYSRLALAAAIHKLNCQVIITAIDYAAIEPLVSDDKNYKMFHVKHGEISIE